MLHKYPLRAKSIGRGVAGKSLFFLLLLICLLSFIPSFSAVAAPDTVIIAGPAGTLKSNDLAFWWTGKTATPESYVKGFYYRLDNESWNWTRERVIAYYDISDGSHKLEVRAVDSNNAEDSSAASRSFNVQTSPAVEPDESPFSVEREFVSHLNSGIISDDLRAEFASKGRTLTQNATVSGSGSEWLITDAIAEYKAKKEGNKLNIYQADRLFSMDWDDFEDDLDSGDITTDLENEFEDHDISLSGSASLSNGTGNEWTITDGDETYTIQKDGDNLRVYTDQLQFGIELFQYIVDRLNAGIVSESLRQEFNSNGIALPFGGTVSVEAQNSRWLIVDSGAGRAYIISKESGADKLNIYESINDEASEATSLVLGTAIECLSQADSDDAGGVDEDWFRVNVASQSGQPVPRQLTVFFHRPDSTGSTTIEIYRHPRLNQEIGSFQAEDRAFFATGITPGDYLVRVVPDGEAPDAAYFLTVTADSLASEIIWDTENNDNSNSATETPSVFLSNSASWVEMVGNRWSASDNTDWFKIHVDVNRPTRLNLNLTPPQSGSTSVTLYPVVLMSAVGGFVVTPASSPQWKLETGVEQGEYLLEVDLGQHDLDSPYFLTMQLSSFPAGEVWEQEPNDIADFANQLPIGVRVRATKGHAADTRDWFRFAVPNDGILNLTTSRILGVGAVNIYMLDPILMSPVGGPLAYEAQEEQQKDWLNMDITAGEYLVEVDLTKFSSDYWLTAMFITSIQHNVPAEMKLSVGDVLSVEMVWDPGNAAAFDVFTPDGKLNDQPIPMDAAGGVYVGTYVIEGADNAEDEDYVTDAWIVAHLQNQAGNTANIPVGDEFVIDTTPPDTMPPEIAEVRHNVDDGVLQVGEELVVTIEGEADGTATFDIGDYLVGLRAYDDGRHDDGAADDGVYVGAYTVAAEDYVTGATITGHLVDKNGNSASLDALPPVDIVGDRPVIKSVDHDARLTLGQGDTLKVTLVGDPDGIASFDIAGLVSGVPMYDDGQHDDGDRGDGTYVGTYEIMGGDDALGATVTARLLDRRGKETSKISQLGVNIDAVAPAPVVGVTLFDRPDDQGGFLSLDWDASTELDFSHYNIYLSKDSPILVSAGGVVGLSPVISDITNSTQTSVDVAIDSDLTDYFAAVTAVDIMGNESLLDAGGGSMAGPAQAFDNLRPTSVREVMAVDRERDFGGVIILSWTDVNQDDDFARYNIYQAAAPILSTTVLTPVDSIPDRYVTVVDIPVSLDLVDYYFAVTSVDQSGNESELDEFGGSVAGPVHAENNIGVEPDGPVKFLSGPVGTIHHNHAAFHWSRFQQPPGTPHTGYYFRLDDANWQWMTGSTVVYYDLRPGDHTFSVRPGGQMVEISRSFTVVPVVTSECEPNDSQNMACAIRSGMVIRGDGSGGDDDWFRIHIPLTEPGILDILFSRPESIGSTEVAVYAGQPFRELARLNSDGGQPAHFAIGAAPESDYFVRVSSDNDDSQYGLVTTVDRLPAGFGWEVEDNDAGTSANPLSVALDAAVEVRGISDGGQDHDWFKLHVPDDSFQNPVWMSVCFHRPDISTSTTVEIYSTSPDVAGRQIVGFPGARTSCPQFTGVVEPGGDYFIKIDNGDEPAFSDYHFLISLSEIPADEGTAWEVEPNGLSAWANPLQLGIKQRGTSWDGNEDDDWYVLDTENWKLKTENGILNLHFSRLSGTGSTLVELYDAAFQVMGSFQVGITDAQKGSVNLDVETGKYYVRVHPQNEAPDVEYELIALLVESVTLSRLSDEGEEIERDGRPLKTGDVIQLSLAWGVGASQATFDVGDIAADLPMIEQGDGVYVGTYTVAEGDNESAARFTIHLVDQFGNAADLELDEIVTVDTSPPEIINIFHDGINPLSAGKKLTVTMIGDPRGAAKFDISGFKTGLDMYNMTPDETDPPLIILNWDWRPDPTFGSDGAVIVVGRIKNVSDSTKDFVRVDVTFYDGDAGVVGTDFAYTTPPNITAGVAASFKVHADYTGREVSAKLRLVYGVNRNPVGESADDGVYVGSYEIGDNDEVSDAAIICYLTDSAGNQSTAEASSTVTFDTIPPVINTLTHDADKILVEGDILTVTMEGESGGAATFDIGNFRTGLKMSIAEPGRYVGTYRIRAGDGVTGALITGHLKDAAGNETSYIGVRTVSISTSAPEISAVTHNGATRPFIEGETLTVTVNATPGVKATFDVEGLVSDNSMHGDGVYTGSYVIRKGDNVTDARVSVTVISPNGKSLLRESFETVSVDTEPPASVTGVSALDKPDDEGGYIVLNWIPSNAEDFSHYNIYQSEQPIITLRGLTPIDEISNVADSSMDIAVLLPVPRFPVPVYYFAVTAVDVATNESLLTRDSADGPASGMDNLPPAPVGKVFGYDRAYDNGKIITITWSDPSTAEDFYRYHIYMDTAPITSISILAPVDASITDRNVLLADIVTPEDGVGFFFAVTAIDLSGNESLITDDSVAGPIASEDNLGAVPDTLVKIISGPVGEIHYDDVTFRWNRWFRGQPGDLSKYYYKLDSGNWVWTSNTYITYYGLQEGEHTFLVRADLGPGNTDPMPASRAFAVKRILLPETEPNGSAGRANWISKGMTIYGINGDDSDDDWYRFHVESNGLMTLHFNRINGIGSTEITVFRSFPPTSDSSIGTLTANPTEQRQSFSVGAGIGDYFLLVNSQGEDPDARYEISLSTNELPEGIQWDREKNDLPALAQLSILETENSRLKTENWLEVSGSGNKPDDVDWYRLQVSGLEVDAPASMSLEFVRPGGIGSTSISLYAAFPYNLESSRVGMVTLQPANNQSQRFSVPARSGDYYLRVDNSQEAESSSIYSFRVSFAPISGNWEVEPNGNYQFANLLPMNQVMKGTSWHPDDDADWYQLRLDRRGILVVSYFRPFGTGSAEITLKNANRGDIAAASASVLTGQKATIDAELSLGNYFVVVKPENEEDASAEYQLVATLVRSVEMEVQYPVFSIQYPVSILGPGASLSLIVVWEPGNAISFDIGELKSDLPLHDDAQNGAYVGAYTVQEGDDISDAEIILHLTMPPGGVTPNSALPAWTADLRLDDTITIDTTPPKIARVDHSARLYPLSEGETLTVTMTGEAGALDAYFEIVPPYDSVIPRYLNIPMEERSDGNYSGSYTVEEKDDLETAFVVCHLMDAAGNESLKPAERSISFDTIAPEIISVHHDASETLVENDLLTVTVVSDTMNGKATFSIDGLAADRLMYDDGTHGDSKAYDGVYTGQYLVRKGNNVADASVSVRLTDKAGNTSEDKAFEPISIDTAPPEIASFVHDAVDILSEGDILTVTLRGDPGNLARFDIEGFQASLPMYDDGTRSDNTSGDGVYVGTYTVKKGDSAKNARLTGYLTDKNDNQTVQRIFERVNIDAVPPQPVSGVQAVDKPDDQGYWLILTWDISSDADFERYNIYRESAPITSVLGLIPLSDSSTVEHAAGLFVEGQETGNQKSIEVMVSANNVDYYLAVTAVDSGGNESLLNKDNGATGPVKALDNLEPEPVTIVSASDKPDDQGKTVIVSWTKVNAEEDFDRYGIYLSDQPIDSLEGLELLMRIRAGNTILVTGDEFSVPSHGSYVTVLSDGVDFYFAVTAFDQNGNESSLDGNGGSVTGPVRSTDDTPPQPVILVDVVDTPQDNGGSLDVRWLPGTDEEIREYNFYLSEEPIDNDVIQVIRPTALVTSSDVLVQDSVMMYELHTPVDGESFHVTVVAVDFGGNSSSLDKFGGSVSYLVQSVPNTVKAGASITIQAGFDTDTSVYVPAGAIGGGETVDILLPDESIQQKIDEADRFLERSHIDPQTFTYFAETVRVFESSVSSVFQPVEMTLSYPDVAEIQSQATAGANLVFALSQEDELSFRVFRLNEMSRIPRWEFVSGSQEVNTSQNTVSVQMTKFGVFRVARLKLPESLNKVVVYPNPFIPSQSISGQVTFKNLTENATIQIFDMAGRRVRTIDKESGGGDEAIWDVRNSNGDEVASGTYVFIIQSEEDTFTGKIIVLR